MATQTVVLRGEDRRTQVKVGKNEKLPPEAERISRACQDIANALIHEYESLQDDSKPKKDINLNSLRGQAAKKHRLSSQPALTQILAAVPENYKKAVSQKLLAKPIRTASGIAVVSLSSYSDQLSRESFIHLATH